MLDGGVAVAYLETTGDRHLQLIGGVTALERRVRELAKGGAEKVVVVAPVASLPRVTTPVEFVAALPAGVTAQRADVVAGIELVDADACKRAEWQLIRRMNKSFEGPVDALINWRFSMRITRVLSHRSLAVTPNHITICAIVIGLFASYLVSRGELAMIAIAGVLLEFNSILDSCDGELARLRFQYSKLGQWLDNLSDDIVDNLFIAAAGYGIGGDLVPARLRRRGWAFAGVDPSPTSRSTCAPAPATSSRSAGSSRPTRRPPTTSTIPRRSRPGCARSAAATPTCSCG